MGRKCSHCGNMGHNSRTCISYKGNISMASTGNIGLRLFGVQLVDMSSSCSSSSAISQAFDMKKSFSMDCLMSSPNSPSSSSSLVSINEVSDQTCIGYLSDGLLARAQERKKGVPWTEEEHRAFLAGLQKLGKGDWRGISRKFVTTRTPTQVASHAQKHFLRQATLDKKKRRSSLFDMSNSSNGKQRGLTAAQYFDLSSSFDDVHEDNNLPMIDLNLSEHHHVETRRQETDNSQPAVSHHHSISIWPYGSKNSQTNCTSSNPDLELKLAAPNPNDENKASESLQLSGAISVT
ncbi:transcription factor KUA1 [Heracleum sosnowskyi]|uniref:Transcription factor KUA1 n=1 Tax=Heracleum sosnowskyi TaxID=360622 RepID=A0AAD8GV65_9APIA|nr:transcription factor KUA1 [Heracleum sosnowskyi]